MTPPRISAAILTFNEQRNIRRCLESLTWADEVVVLDSGSTDGTVEIARALAHRVLSRPWPGFQKQRAAAVAECSGDWVIFVDADEWVPEALAREVRAAVNDPRGHAGFLVSRRNRFLDRWIDHAWGPDHILRVFRREAVSFGGFEPHVHALLAPGLSTGMLSAPLYHAPFQTIDELSVKASAYSRAFAESDETDALYSPLKLVFSPLIAVFKMLVLRRGLQDGVHGLILAWATGHYHFLKYAKKWQKLRRRPDGAAARTEAEHVRG